MPRLTTKERQKRQNLLSAKCRVFRHEWDGTVYVEATPAGTRWVGRFECDCGTQRIDFMMPHSFELTSRKYVYPPEYQTDMNREQAKVVLFTSMMVDKPAEDAEDDDGS